MAFNLSWLRTLCQKIPLAGEIAYSEPKALRGAGSELLLIWFFTSIPLLLNSFIDLMGTGAPSSENRFVWAISNNLKVAEVFIYINALLAPAFVLIWKHNRDLKYFRNHMPFLIALHLLLVFSALLFGLHRGGMKFDPAMLSLAALILYLGALFIRFLCLIPDGFSDFSKMQKNQEQKLTHELDGFNGGAQ